MALSRAVSEIGLRRVIDSKLPIFPSLPSFNALGRGDTFRISGKALRILKLVFVATHSKNFVILSCVVLTQYSTVIGEQTDERKSRR